MVDGERLLALDAFLAAAGIPGCWTERGPTEKAQVLLHRGRARGFTRDQRFAIAVAFHAWRTEGPGPWAVETLALDAETLDAFAVLAHRWNGRPPRR